MTQLIKSSIHFENMMFQNDVLQSYESYSHRIVGNTHIFRKKLHLCCLDDIHRDDVFSTGASFIQTTSQEDHIDFGVSELGPGTIHDLLGNGQPMDIWIKKIWCSYRLIVV